MLITTIISTTSSSSYFLTKYLITKLKNINKMKPEFNLYWVTQAQNRAEIAYQNLDEKWIGTSKTPGEYSKARRVLFSQRDNDCKLIPADTPESSPASSVGNYRLGQSHSAVCSSHSILINDRPLVTLALQHLHHKDMMIVASAIMKTIKQTALIW